MFPRVQPLAYGGGLWNGLPIQAHSVALQALATLGVLGALAGGLWIAGLFATLSMRPSNGQDGREQLGLAVGCISLVVFGAFNHVGMAGAGLFIALSAMLIRNRDETCRGRVPASGRGAVASIHAGDASHGARSQNFEALAAADRA
jgi:hypothetical protein